MNQLFPTLQEMNTTSQGILFTVLGVAAAVLVFFLIQWAQVLFRSGGEFTASVHRIETSDPNQVKLNLVVFNQTKKDKVLVDPYLYRKNAKGEKVVLSKMSESPIGRNFKTNIEEKDGVYSFPFPAGVRSDLVLEFRIEADLPPNTKIYLGGTNASGKTVAASIDLDGSKSETISFRKQN